MEQKTQGSNGKDYLLNFNDNTRKVVFVLATIFCISPFASPPIALLLGIVLAQLIGHPFIQHNSKAVHLLLQISVIGLGFGMNVNTALRAGKEGFLFTVVSISGTLVLGYFLGKLFKVNEKTSFLVSTGTAICGGSAIAAVSPVIKAEEKQISVALGIVFILNSVALLIFPLMGKHLQLSQSDFGLWSAIAIHDTSSVVGAASVYGNEALQIATTVKLARALWIIPVAFLSGIIFKSKEQKIKIPYFIGMFVLAIVVNTYVPFIQSYSANIVAIAKTGLTVTLFLIGAGLSKKTITSVGFNPILQGLILWFAISISSLLAILYL